MAEPYNPMLRRRSLLGGVAETTWGTNVLSSITGPLTKTAVYDAKIELLDVYGQGKRRPMSPYGGGRKAVPGRQAARLTFVQELCFSDAFATLAGAMGMVTSGGITTFQTALTNHKTFSFKLWRDGRVEQIYGAAGSAIMNLEAGKPVMLNWTFDGVWGDLGSDASVPADSFPDELPFVAMGMAFTIGGAAFPRFERMTLDFGVKVQPITSMAASKGIAYFLATDRDPKLMVDTESRKKADLDAFSKITTPTEVVWAATLTDGDANTLDFDAPAAQYIGIAPQEREDVFVDALTFQLNGSSGDDELSITKTT